MLSLEDQIRLIEWQASFNICKAVEKGEYSVNLFRIGSKEEDRLIIEANHVILDTLGNADSVGQIEMATGRNLRDQLSVAEALEMEKEIKLRGMGVARN